VGVSARRARLADGLAEARARTLALLDPVPPADQARQISPLMSPLCWDLGHVAHFEELWLLRTVARVEPTMPRLDDVYDAFEHPRAERPELDLLDPVEAREFAADVRKRALDVLATVGLEDTVPLLEGGFVYGMIVQHEHQHIETMLATIQLMEDFVHPDVEGLRTTVPDVEPDDLFIEGGGFVMGTDDAPFAYDNERPAHEVEVAPFRIDAAPVTNRAYLEFMEDGGYRDPRWWSERGWAWRNEAGLAHPEFWRPAGAGEWERRRFGRWEPVPPDQAVQHVCWYEADAYARWRGKRLPTEAEWEKASSRGLDGVGSVWEWTASDFGGYPGFEAFPYREYSEVFFGPEYKVLRGSSWATDPWVARPTFRNWDYPIRRQVFVGFRCARDS
jgi:iron(II)-dependent oxidoreductase